MSRSVSWSRPELPTRKYSTPYLIAELDRGIAGYAIGPGCRKDEARQMIGSNAASITRRRRCGFVRQHLKRSWLQVRREDRRDLHAASAGKATLPTLLSKRNITRLTRKDPLG